MSTFRRLTRRMVVAFVAVWTFGATATADTPSVSHERRSAVTCVVVEDEDTLELGVVMQLITYCPDELELSDTQRARLARVGRKFIDETLRLEADREAAKEDLAELVRPDPRDPGRPVHLAAAEAKIREIERVVSDQEIAALRAVEESKAMLTASQRVRLAVLLDEVRGGHQHVSRTPIQ